MTRPGDGEDLCAFCGHPWSDGEPPSRACPRCTFRVTDLTPGERPRAATPYRRALAPVAGQSGGVELSWKASRLGKGDALVAVLAVISLGLIVYLAVAPPQSLLVDVRATGSGASHEPPTGRHFIDGFIIALSVPLPFLLYFLALRAVNRVIVTLDRTGLRMRQRPLPTFEWLRFGLKWQDELQKAFERAVRADAPAGYDAIELPRVDKPQRRKPLRPGSSFALRTSVPGWQLAYDVVVTCPGEAPWPMPAVRWRTRREAEAIASILAREKARLDDEPWCGTVPVVEHPAPPAPVEPATADHARASAAGGAERASATLDPAAGHPTPKPRRRRKRRRAKLDGSRGAT